MKEFALRAQKEIKLVVYFKLIIQNVNQSKTKKKNKNKGKPEKIKQLVFFFFLNEMWGYSDEIIHQTRKIKQNITATLFNIYTQQRGRGINCFRLHSFFFF